ncbi:MAG: SlyX family protein [Parvibaculum sp.]|uniref:SlyX family protein n=1 Tax=Parvibaculum sp. TaxID=2024848 RepID=UPI003C784BDC
MTDISALSRRIDELEIQLAHQDQTIEDLNDTIARQWLEIEALARKLDNLGTRVHAVEETSGEPAPVEPPPPHY